MSNTSLSGVVQSAPDTSPGIDVDTVVTLVDSTVVFLDNAQLNDLPFQHSSIAGRFQ
ncbi:hypothetical protein ACO0K9_20080 [Undibacterium sp. Ji50W]|uniref:hypothetical protein n=1 Tax=Undibacterium sp. Ji50W TaxID=3413041 RepID=UPI003BF06678